MKKLVASSLFAMLMICSFQNWAQSATNWDAFYRYLSTKISYPAEARAELLQGDNIITFNLDKGMVKNVNIQSQLSTKTDLEVANLILAYPAFKPAQNGSYAIRTSFRLQGANSTIINQDAQMPTGFKALSTININAMAPAIANAPKNGKNSEFKSENGTRIVLRGSNSQTAGQPLYVVDDKTVENFEMAALAPESIDSVQILKSLSAVALYGKAAENGVIVITTKKYASEKSKKTAN
ncbi:TonB-dependent receptor plug domain-containing protein [Pedobacter sp. KR3-3]|uniref:TonB-dependent receptor plug domain-containing protein n=1 Tax=Pedobacter albus TaxID=3113905 RepID=A0ABU7I9X7_9SPHI|nr:TonB-dependent receptor plug domain-containing protein [Pedobacter sp. KR3-3]MEE1946161.1 TonB-dependent receptor plug domain-containing protein [Pedobacter sp. KR3-3]